MGKAIRGAALMGLALCFALCGVRAGIAQNTNSGDIRGTVTDASGAVVPGVTNVNFSLGKNFNLAEIANHSIVMQIRADATNVFNHPSFGQPDTTIGPGHTAQITSVTVGGRTMQLYGRISF